MVNGEGHGGAVRGSWSSGPQTSRSRSRGPRRRGCPLGVRRCLGLGLTLTAATLGTGLGVVGVSVSETTSSITAGDGIGIGAGGVRTCEPIRVELCRTAVPSVRGYNMTTMPNLAGHEFQKEAESQLSTYVPLVQYGCSKQLLFFLCAVFVPMCTDQVDSAYTASGAHVVAIGPCQDLCKAVRDRCLPVMQNYNYSWPPELDCSKFPPFNSPEHMCMEGPGEGDEDEDIAGGGRFLTPLTSPPRLLGTVTTASVPRCADPPPHFSRADKQMAEVWLSIWAGLCFVSSVLALLTLRLGPGPGGPGGPGPQSGSGTTPAAPGASARTRARAATVGPSPLASLALSYGLLSVGWGVRVLAGRPSSPIPTTATSAALLGSVPGLAPVAPPECDVSDLRNPNCAAVFLLTYYFGTASVVWWVALTAVWFLSVGLRMSAGSLQRHSYLFHLGGWGLPAALTLGVLVLRDVAVDPLTGTCRVGPTWSTVFVLAPQCAFLCMGLVFLALGALTQCRSKPRERERERNRALLWPLAAERLGLLAGVCAMPLSLLVATHALELMATPASVSLRLFQARLAASLVVGVAAPFWVWPGERPWPPCPPRPLAWRYPGPGKQATTPVAAASANVGSVPGSVAVPLLATAVVGNSMPPTATTTAHSSASTATTRLTATSGRSRTSKQQRSAKHHRHHHGNETTV